MIILLHLLHSMAVIRKVVFNGIHGLLFVRLFSWYSWVVIRRVFVLRAAERTRRGCARYPCWNSGTCADDASDPRGYTCACQPGTWGDHCETCKQQEDVIADFGNR